MRKKGKDNKGITLIALVVTIVVLIILAVISINAVLGENGIIRRAEQARQHQANAEASDNEALGSLDEQVGNVLGELKVAVPGQKVIGENAIYTDSNEETAPIPVGFAVVTDPDTIDNGLVISDVENDDMANSKGGNQFVWIPVPDYSKFHLIEGYSYGELQTLLSDRSIEAGASKTEILPGKPNVFNTAFGTDESVAMYNSVKTNKGFYIARFEAGISKTRADGTIVDNYSLDFAQTTDGTVKPLSKKSVGVWNCICWGSGVLGLDKLPGDDTTNGAVKVARSMYPNLNKLEVYKLPTNLTNDTGVISTLCYGVQWDAVMNFIDNKYYTGTCADDSFVKNSDKQGNYLSSGVVSTGNYEVKHIYDLGGNVNEWTMESLNSDYRVVRGDCYLDDGLNNPASDRWEIDSFYWAPVVWTGFRVALYL